MNSNIFQSPTKVSSKQAYAQFLRELQAGMVETMPPNGTMLSRGAPSLGIVGSDSRTNRLRSQVKARLAMITSEIEDVFRIQEEEDWDVRRAHLLSRLESAELNLNDFH